MFAPTTATTPSTTESFITCDRTGRAETEIRRVLSNLGAVLKEAGMSYENVVKATIFTTDLKNYKLINTIYGEHFKEKPPARETVQVVALPAGAHVEISCIAVKYN